MAAVSLGQAGLMAWPLNAPNHWTTPWQQGEDVLLLCPWRADGVMATLGEAFYPLLRGDQTVWLIAPNTRWLQGITAKLAPTRLPFAILDGQTTAKQAQYIVQRWQAGDYVAVVLDDAWVSTWIEANPDHPADVLIGVDAMAISASLNAPLTDMQALWLSPPLPAYGVKHLREVFGVSQVSTLPLDPFKAVLQPHGHLTDTQIMTLADRLSYFGPTVWTSDNITPPPGSVVDDVSWDRLPFLLTDGTMVITPDADIQQLLTLLTSGLDIQVHQLNVNLKQLPYKLPYQSKSNPCHWQHHMAIWQGAGTPPIPPCGRCNPCRKAAHYVK